MADEVDDFFNTYTGTGAPAAKFKKLGDKVTGTITKRSIVKTKDQKTKEEIKNLVIELADASGIEDGVPFSDRSVSVWVKPSQLLQAISSALREAGAKRVEVDDRIAVEYYDEEPTALSPKKLYRVAYKVAVSATSASSAALSVDDL